ncbi:Hypothetical predicted protein, partial [Pelobates cultripes]
MADAFLDMGMESLSASEDRNLSDMQTQIPQRRQQTAPPGQPEQPLATKVDLSGIVTDLKAFFTTELAGLQIGAEHAYGPHTSHGRSGPGPEDP